MLLKPLPFLLSAILFTSVTIIAKPCLAYSVDEMPDEMELALEFYLDFHGDEMESNGVFEKTSGGGYAKLHAYECLLLRQDLRDLYKIQRGASDGSGSMKAFIEEALRRLKDFGC